MSNNCTTTRRNRTFLKADSITLGVKPVLVTTNPGVGEFGKLTLKKENGAVKGFEYECVCGHKDYFVCE